MLLWLTHYLAHHHHRWLNVFQYLTLRMILSTLTSLLVAFILGPFLIKRLTASQVKQVIRQEGPQSHYSKAGTPTMGGTLILTAILIAVLLWADLSSRYIWVVLLTMIGFGLIGWIDDEKKLALKHSRGLSARWKYLLQSLIGLSAALFLYSTARVPAETQLIVPFFKHIHVSLGWFYVVFAYFVIVGSSNAVNLTDGLDGLAIMPTAIIGAALGVFAYVAGNYYFSKYLLLPFIPGAGELMIICGALVGAGLGFLWYNAYPAQVFMGDVGALGLGAALGVISIIVRQELVYCLMGGIFVVETLSVVIQVASFKLTGKRVFRMAPLHHHFELKGWPEPRVIVRFCIITFILVLFGLATLKLR